jgi:hypothetical protein
VSVLVYSSRCNTSATMVNTTCVIDIIILTGCLLFGHKNSRRHGRNVVVVCFLLTPMLIGIFVLVVQEGIIGINQRKLKIMSVELSACPCGG